MATADFLDQKRHEITARLNELKPLVDEYQRLDAAAAALDGVSATPLLHGTPATRHAPAGAKATAARKRGATHGRRGRPKGSGTRGAEALALVKAQPGITIPELAEKMGIKQNYLYRVLPGLAADGLVVKDGRGWKPKDADNTPTRSVAFRGLIRLARPSMRARASGAPAGQPGVNCSVVSVGVGRMERPAMTVAERSRATAAVCCRSAVSAPVRRGA